MNISHLLSLSFKNSPKDFSISGVKLSSININKGDIFICFEEGEQRELALAEAVKRGVACIILSGKSTNWETFQGIPLLQVDNLRRLLTHIAATYYPQNIQNIIGITGTYGKTSTVSFIRQLLTISGKKAGSLGTEGVWIGRDHIPWIPKIITTPPAFHLYYLLHFLYSEGLTHFAMEVTSHGLHRYRVDEIPFKVGAFTNLSHSHLDYHLTMKQYYLSKRRFFSEILQEGSIAIIPHDQEWTEDLLSICRLRNLKPIIIGQDLRLEKSILSDQGTEIEISFFGGRKHLLLPHLSGFQVDNALFALGSLVGLGIDFHLLQHITQYLKSPVGRMELIANFNDASIFVDFAHRPETFEKILKPLHDSGKKIVLVFGCGGGRYKERRKELGRIASAYATKVIITDDNARDEDPAAIRKMIKEGCPSALEISCRKTAIKEAIASLQPNNVCIIAGRGNEDMQVVGKKIIPFNDKEEVVEIIQNLNKRDNNLGYTYD